MLDRSRFESALPREKLVGTYAFVFGVGNLGSALVRGLAQLGIERFHLIDPDEVEEANVTTQGYDDTYVGWDKVEAMRSIIRRVNPALNPTTTKKKSNDVPGYGLPVEGHAKSIVIAAVDSIEARKDIFTKFGERAQLYIDPRMALDDFEVTFLRTDPASGADPKIDEYRKSLDETDHLELPCSARSVPYTGAACAGLVLPQVRRWLVGLQIPYVIHASLAAGRVEPIWREKEKFEAEDFSAQPVEAAG